MKRAYFQSMEKREKKLNRKHACISQRWLAEHIIIWHLRRLGFNMFTCVTPEYQENLRNGYNNNEGNANSFVICLYICYFLFAAHDIHYYYKNSSTYPVVPCSFFSSNYN